MKTPNTLVPVTMQPQAEVHYPKTLQEMTSWATRLRICRDNAASSRDCFQLLKKSDGTFQGRLFLGAEHLTPLDLIAYASNGKATYGGHCDISSNGTFHGLVYNG